jgi:hypothetical protein
LDEDGTERFLEFDALLIATGRKPSVTGLGLKKAEVEFDARKGVVVNDKLQTTNPDLYVVGDVASKYQFTHMADFMARLVIKNALFFGRDKVSNLLVALGNLHRLRKSLMSDFTRKISRNAISPLPPLNVNLVMWTEVLSMEQVPAMLKSM